jgi:YVTN family beta-propeller protein
MKLTTCLNRDSAPYTGFSLAIFLALFLALPIFADKVRIYIANEAGDSIQVIDPTTNKVVQTITGVESPQGMGFSPDGKYVYATSYAEAKLEIIDQETGKIVKQVPISGFPDTLAVASDGRIFVGIHDGAAVIDVINGKTLEKVKSIPTPPGNHNLAITADGKYLLAGSQKGRSFTVIDLGTEEVVWKIPIGGAAGPMTIESNPDGSAHRVFIQFHPYHGFCVIDFAARKEIQRIDLPAEPVMSEYMKRGAAPSHGALITPDGKYLWILSAQAQAAFIYSLPDLKLLGHAVTGEAPQWLCFTPDSKFAYISNSAAATISVIDTKTWKEVGLIPAGELVKRSSVLVLPDSGN